MQLVDLGSDLNADDSLVLVNQLDPGATAKVDCTAPAGDATGTLTGATFRDQEDTAGYLTILRDTVRRLERDIMAARNRLDAMRSHP